MGDIKALNRTFRSNNSVTKKIVEELTEIRKALHDTDRRLILEELEPYQAKNSPYLPDRDYHNPLAVKGNPEETKWKEVPTYEEQRSQWVEHNSMENEHLLVTVNKKKLNII
jgi:hypothetical protein